MHATLASIQIFQEDHRLIELQQILSIDTNVFIRRQCYAIEVMNGHRNLLNTLSPNIQASNFPKGSFHLRNCEGLMQQ